MNAIAIPNVEYGTCFFIQFFYVDIYCSVVYITSDSDFDSGYNLTPNTIFNAYSVATGADGLRVWCTCAAITFIDSMWIVNGEWWMMNECGAFYLKAHANDMQSNGNAHAIIHNSKYFSTFHFVMIVEWLTLGLLLLFFSIWMPPILIYTSVCHRVAERRMGERYREEQLLQMRQCILVWFNA